MSSGGYRPGAGRPKGTARQIEQDARQMSEAQSPLEYMLGVMRDPEADAQRRDRMAIAAAPFVHGRPTADAPGKRQRQALDAEAAARGRFAAPAPPPAAGKSVN